MNSDKTLILMDTNKIRSMFGKSPRYDSFGFDHEFKTLKNFIEENSLSENIILAVADMTLQELLVQKKKAYEKDKVDLISASKRLKTLKNISIPDFDLPDDSFDCVEYLNPKVTMFLQENSITTIKIEDGKKASVLDSLVQGVIESKPPFKVGKNSGFKDAIIWETLIKHSIKNGCSNVILFTHDKDFDGCMIVDINFKIIKSMYELTSELKSTYAKKIREKKYDAIARKQYLISKLEQMIVSEFDIRAENVSVISLTEDIIDSPILLKEIFSSLDESAAYFENMVCFVSKIKISDREAGVNVLFDESANEILTIQGETIGGAE